MADLDILDTDLNAPSLTDLLDTDLNVPRPPRLIRIDGYLMDLAVSEGFVFPGEVTKFPAEVGPDTSDHIRDLPPEISLECIVSDLPSDDIAQDPSRQNDSPGNEVPLPSEDALAKLLEMKARRRPVTIETSFGSFTSMACEKIEITRDKDKNNALFFKADFKKFVEITNTRQRVRVKTQMSAGKPQTNAEVSFEVRIDDRITWRHGNPPGSLVIESVSEVVVQHEFNAPRLTPKERLAFGRDIVGNPLVRYFEAQDGEFQEIFGDRRRALIRDLERDRGITRQLENRNTGAPAGTNTKKLGFSDILGGFGSIRGPI